MLSINKIENYGKDNLISNIENISEFISNISEFINKIDKEDYTEIKENVWVGDNVTIDPNSNIVGPCIIGDNVIIRPNAYIRENVIIGNNCVIGNSSEIKNSFISSYCQIPHFNYVGDSFLGDHTHLGAGVIISNLKNDKSNIKVNNKDTGLRKLGIITGSNVEVGCNSVIFPGTIIKSNVSIYPLTRVRGIIEENTIVKDEYNIVKRD